MASLSRRLLALGLTCLLALAPTLVAEEEKVEMVDNPLYQGWATFKVGSTATHIEKVTYSDANAKDVPGGIDEKTVRYKLVEVTPKRVVVQTVVVEKELLSTIESAPTRITYPAKLNAAAVKAALGDVGPKTTEETIKHNGKEYKCKVLSGTMNKDGDAISFKRYQSTDVPGGLVKSVRSAKREGKAVYEATIEVRAFKAAE